MVFAIKLLSLPLIVRNVTNVIEVKSISFYSVISDFDGMSESCRIVLS